MLEQIARNRNYYNDYTNHLGRVAMRHGREGGYGVRGDVRGGMVGIDL